MPVHFSVQIRVFEKYRLFIYTAIKDNFLSIFNDCQPHSPRAAYLGTFINSVTSIALLFVLPMVFVSLIQIIYSNNFI